MTAVAPPPNFQNRWSGSNGVPNGAPPMTTDEFLSYLASHPATGGLGRQLADALVTSGIR